MTPLDANLVAPGLAQGAKLPRYAKIRPDDMYAMRDGLMVRGFHVVVLCAEELQPHVSDGDIWAKQVIHAPLDDSGHPMTQREQQLAVHAAQEVLRALHRQQHVLTTCAMGYNRSGLVNALTLVLSGVPAARAINQIQVLRPGALQNDYFRSFINDVGRAVRRRA